MECLFVNLESRDCRYQDRFIWHVQRVLVSATHRDSSKHRPCMYIIYIANIQGGGESKGGRIVGTVSNGWKNEIYCIIDNIYKYLCSTQEFRRAVYKWPADSPFAILHSPFALPLSSLDQYKWDSVQQPHVN